MAPYPEHAKYDEIANKFRDILEFLEYLENKGYAVGVWAGNNFLPVNEANDELVAEYYAIDLKRLKRERETMARAYRLENRLV